MDVDLDIEDTELSPGVRRMLAAVGHEAPFEQGRQQMELLAGLLITSKAMERTAEAIGEDIEVRQQHELRRALQLELPMPLGPRIPILYVEMDGSGIPVVQQETKGRIWNQASLHFPDAIQIVDLDHAREHLWSLSAKLYPNDAPAQKRWVMVREDKLDQGKIERLVALLRSQAASHPELAEDLRTEANYFEDNQEPMRYPEFRKPGLFVGSGLIEAGCKTVLGRLKRSGMFWTVRGPMPSLPSGAVSAAADSRSIGRPDGPNLHFKVAPPQPLGRLTHLNFGAYHLRLAL